MKRNKGQRGNKGETDSPGEPNVSQAALVEDNARLRMLLFEASRLAEFGRYAAKQVHELRQPLFGIKGLAQLLLDREDVDVGEVRDFARHIVEQSDRLTALLTDLREMSMPSSQYSDNDSERRADVSDVVRRVTAILAWRLRKGIALKTEIAPALPEAATSPHELEQILFNLVSNALDAVADRATPLVQIRARVLGGPGARPMVEVAVADNGSGIAEAARMRLFETFFSTKRAEAGTGLGLAVSREIARAAGGDVDLVQGEAGFADRATTVFHIVLPVAGGTGAAANPRAANPRDANPPDANPQGGNQKGA